jgi:ParB-like chromosome segregation protein Spo0J
MQRQMQKFSEHQGARSDDRGGTSRQRDVLGQNLTVEHRPIESLIPYARNARTHSDAQVAEIAASIKAFGWTNPILVDGENGIVAGHGRLLAARKLGMHTVPVIELSDLGEAQNRAYIIADNKITLHAGWDPQVLALELAGC